MHPGYFPVLLWSLVILLSFWGYGEALRRWINRKEFENLGWGLTTAWGMALLITIGGFLMAPGQAKAANLTVVILIGAVAGVSFAAGMFFSEKKRPGTPWHIPPFYWVAGLLAILGFVSSIAWMNHIDPNDDLVCYLMLPEKILATGTLIEPFSFQRAGTFGGQALLQACVMIVGNEVNGHVPDRGFAMIILFGILLGALRGVKGQYAAAGFALLFAFWFVPVPRISTNGAMTGGCLMVAMLDALSRLRATASAGGWTRFLPSALTAAGACSIRPTFALVIAAVLGVLAMGSLVSKKAAVARWKAIKPLVMMGLLCTLLLLPFMIVLYQSNGTPVIPPFSGFVSKAYQTYDHPALFQNLSALVNFLCAPQSLGLLLVFALAAILPGAADRRLVLAGIALACAVIVIRFGALAYLDLYRYIYPIIFPVALYYLALALRRASEDSAAEPSGDSLRMSAAVVVGAVAVLAILNVQQAGAELGAQFASLEQQTGEPRTFLDPRLKNAYREVQDAVPPGEKILTMVDASYLLDYKRNPMFSVNAVGGSSPPPGLPFDKGPEALAAYLKSLGIRYILAVDFDNAVLLYTRKLWTETTRPEWFYPQIWRPRFLGVMDSIDALDREGKVTARAGNLRLIDLNR